MHLDAYFAFTAVERPWGSNYLTCIAVGEEFSLLMLQWVNAVFSHPLELTQTEESRARPLIHDTFIYDDI